MVCSRYIFSVFQGLRKATYEVLNKAVPTRLVNLVPPLRVLDADESVVVKQGLAQDRVSLVHDGVVERGEASHVLAAMSAATTTTTMHYYHLYFLNSEASVEIIHRL
jgi:hypothetical protein